VIDALGAGLNVLRTTYGDIRFTAAEIACAALGRIASLSYARLKGYKPLSYGTLLERRSLRDA
jgi:hypothetical protein